jgi:dihydroorotase
MLLRSVKIVDARSPYHNQTKDVWIENGVIRQIGDELIVENTEVLSGQNWHLSPGWVDMRVTTGDPGLEHKEDLQSVCAAAAAGGFTEIAILPNTQPALDSKDTVGYVQRGARGQLVNVHPIAAITKQCEGKDFTEMIDLTHAGAVGFSDGVHPIQNTHIFLKSLQYLQPLNRVLINRPEDTHLTAYGQMNEGVSSTLLGMRGMPAVAEEIMIMRDLKLLEYLGVTAALPVLHFSTISTATGVQLIREAKAKGLPISCDVAAHQLVLDDTALGGFDSNYKVNPPFRTAADIDALWLGLADGTIDAVVSDHSPHEEEAKNLEFDMAEFGITGLETAFALLTTHNKNLSLPQIIDKITYQPRRILRLSDIKIEEGAIANLTIFDPTIEWTFNKSYSKSNNSPFLGKTLIGKPVYVLNRGFVEKC